MTWTRRCYTCNASKAVTLPGLPLKLAAFMKSMAIVARALKGWTYDQRGHALCPVCSKR